MRAYIKKVVRYISVKPIIGRPVRFLVAIIRLPQTRNMVFEISHQIQHQNNEINHHVNEINHRIDENNHRIDEINHRIDEINHQIIDIKHHQNEFDANYLPALIESLNYQENLRKSLPVVLRQQVRISLKRES